jgi:hypothetical protein
MVGEGLIAAIGLGTFFITFVVGIFFFVFWILMLVDVIQRKFKKDSDKIIWILIIVFTNWVGAIIYYFVVKKPNKK